MNIDNDHLDSYKDQNDLLATFEEFIKGSVAIVNADDKLVMKLATSSAITYGIENNAVITASNIKKGERVFYTRKNALFIDSFRKHINMLPEYYKNLMQIL